MKLPGWWVAEVQTRQACPSLCLLHVPPNPGQNLGTFGEMQNVAKPYVGLSALSLDSQKSFLLSEPFLSLSLFGHTMQHAGSQFPDQGLKSCPLQWKHRVLITGPLGKSPLEFLKNHNEMFTSMLGTLPLPPPPQLFRQNLSYQGNANQNHNDIPPHTYRMARIKKFDINKYCQGCGEISILVHCWWDCKLVWLLWKTVWWFQKVKQNYPMIQLFHH